MHAKQQRYFDYSPYVGLSSFIQKQDTNTQRGAILLSVGVLVPTGDSLGRLGRLWKHAASLQTLSKYALFE